MDKGSNHKDGCPQTKKAEEIQKSLSPQHPSFIKIIKRPHVSRPFYTCPPTNFSKKHLPESDEIIVFEVESKKTYVVKFFAMPPAFSCGNWKEFAEAEKLLENDVLVFYLMEPSRFKVYIVRANEFLPIDKAPIVSKNDHRESTREVDYDVAAREHRGKDMENVYQKRASGSDLSDKLPRDSEDDHFTTEIEVEKKRTCERNTKRLRLIPPSSHQEKTNVIDSSVKSSIRPHSSKSSDLDGFQPSEFVFDFKSFNILFNDKTIELEREVQKSYFELCCSRKSYFHCRLIKIMDRALAASIISLTVDIANRIRESNVFTPQADIMEWNKVLAGCELLGMEVGFIQARLNRLSGLTLDLERYKEANIEFRCVEQNIVELKKEKKRLQEKSEDLGKEHEERYEEEASASW